jgi:nucleotide-binding universal stress UspA family protein
MTDRAPAPTGRRIVVALDASSRGDVVLEVAAELGVLLRWELLGLYVEDTNVLRATELPFVREIGAASGIVRDLTPLDVERQFQAQERRARQALAALAERSRVRWEFRVTRGLVLHALLASAEETDVIGLGPARWSPRAWPPGTSGSGPVLPPTAAPRPGVPRKAREVRPVVTVYDGTPAAVSCLGIGGHLARTRRHPLVVLVPEGDSGRWESLKSAATRELGEADGGWVRYQPLASADPAAIVEAATEARASVLVAPASSLPLGVPATLLWLARLECPVLVTRS